MNISLLLIFFSFIISATCGFIFIPQIIRYCNQKRIFDSQDFRKIHTTNIPRLGGLSFLPSMFIALLISVIILNVTSGESMIKVSLWTFMFFISLVMIYVVGLIDDIIGLDAKTKFLVQIIAAALLPASNLYLNNLYGFLGIYEIPFVIGAPLTVFVIVFINNAYNLIDGIDGLSACLSFIALGGFLFCFHQLNMLEYCILIAGLMGVLLSYAYFNVFGSAEKKHKIFMGDSGSLTLGFIMGFLAIKYAMDNTDIMPYRKDSLLLSYTLLIVPCFDVVRIILSRFKNKKSLFDADKNHIHHKIMRTGCSQHQTLGIIVALQLMFIAVNHIIHPYIACTWVVAIDILLFTLFHLGLDFTLSRKGKQIFEVNPTENHTDSK